MSRITTACLALVFAAALPLSAQQAVKPIRYTWIPVTVSDWQSAASALLASGGDGTVLILPTADSAHPWVILKRVEEGSVYVPDDEPHACDVFATSNEAMARYVTMAGCQRPTLIVSPAGQQVLLSLRKCDESRRRAVR